MMDLAPLAKLEWHRPVIRDLGPPNRDDRAELESLLRPTDEQTAAGHRVVKKKWQKQAKRRSEENPSKPADVRLAHLRWRELQRLMRHRYRTVMPDTDAARRDLTILIGYAVLCGKKVQHQVDLWAPWLDEGEAYHLAAQRAVLHKADVLAKMLDLQYFDRQALAITTIGAIDVDQDERNRLRLERRNEAKRQKRAAAKQETSTMIDHPPERLTPRQRIVLKTIGDVEIAAPDLVDRLARYKVFRGASMRQRVHEALDHLVAVGLVADRYAPGQKGPVRHVSRQQQ
jgi:hypothetical protein